MNFCYRGIKYNKEPLSLEMLDGETLGKYRGQTLKYRYPRHIPHLQPKVLMQYRGVAYSTKYDANSQAQKVNQEPKTAQSCVCHLAHSPSRKPKITTTAQIHLENLRSKLEHRLQVAKLKGDEYLINLLEQEYQQLTEVV
jgi:hypothetical protein